MKLLNMIDIGFLLSYIYWNDKLLCQLAIRILYMLEYHYLHDLFDQMSLGIRILQIITSSKLFLTQHIILPSN